MPDYLLEMGYRILPVNPEFAGRHAFGTEFASSLAELAEPVDLVDVFRREAAIPDHVREVLRLSPRPRVLWLQQGLRLRDPVLRAAVRDAGIELVEDRCTYAEHRRFGLGPRPG